MVDKQLKIEYIETDKLTPYNQNSKIHTKEQIRHIANSIEQFGFNDPLGIAGKNNTVLEGNGRIEAAKLLKIEKLPCVRLDHLSFDEQKAYIIAHNSLNLETGFDDAVLYSQLNELKDFNFENYGLNTEKYLETLDTLQKKVFESYKKVHYLVTANLNDNDKIIDLIDKLRKIEGVEVDATVN
jgi:ParB-like chromosome segregation protein Spo0J